MRFFWIPWHLSPRISIRNCSFHLLSVLQRWVLSQLDSTATKPSWSLIDGFSWGFSLGKPSPNCTVEKKPKPTLEKKRRQNLGLWVLSCQFYGHVKVAPIGVAKSWGEQEHLFFRRRGAELAWILRGAVKRDLCEGLHWLDLNYDTWRMILTVSK